MPDLHPAYLIAGDDDLLLARALERLLTELRRADPDLDVEVAEVAETPQLPELRTASLFGGRRCVVLRGAEGITGQLAQELTEYLSAPPPDAILILLARGTARIQGIAKRVAKVGERIDVAAPASWDARGWERLAQQELARAGHDADVLAIKALVAHAGVDAAAIASKAGQVAAALPEGARVTVEDVERVVEGHGNRGGFAVADAVMERDPAAALVALRGSLESGEAPLALLGALTFRVRQLVQVRAGASAKDAGVSPGQYRRLQSIARSFNPGELAWAHDRVGRADLDLKGSELPSDVVLELAVLDLATAREVGAPWNVLSNS
ncbi:MAG TPA: DNA polymerase III subunit delta [Solirubrobacteraceae bacterium]|nr:DNA polymerase III subunit delta [Solirubrobacteraceae bacterium]